MRKIEQVLVAMEKDRRIEAAVRDALVSSSWIVRSMAGSLSADSMGRRSIGFAAGAGRSGSRHIDPHALRTT